MLKSGFINTSQSSVLIIIFFVIIGNAFSTSELISYQGRLTDSDGAPLPDSTYLLSFTIFTDSTGNNAVWSESGTITTDNGFFNHMLGSATPFPLNLFMNNEKLYLGVQINGEILMPRILLASVPYSIIAGDLKVTDNNDIPVITTSGEERKFSIYDLDGEEKIILQDANSDSAVILPDSSINSKEMLNEPGLAINTNIDLIPLLNGEMIDLVEVSITIPEDGYIVLTGKCYLLLSGTTGPNTAIIQIDETEGGGTQFPYYTIAGLSGYVNSSTNYFPVFVNRIYYKQQGTYSFRLEGRASDPLPAQARSWDHVLMAIYYPTSYSGVKVILPTSLGYPGAEQIIVNDSVENHNSGIYYKTDLRYLEDQVKENKKSNK
ncbi:MAG: hypothetical protein ACE5D6_05345 [Candidatus Zixiibacteriota bacterium]